MELKWQLGVIIRLLQTSPSTKDVNIWSTELDSGVSMPYASVKKRKWYYIITCHDALCIYSLLIA